MAQYLRALAADLPEELGSIPNTLKAAPSHMKLQL